MTRLEGNNLPTEIIRQKNDTLIRRNKREAGVDKAQVDKNMTRNGHKISNRNGKSTLSSKRRKQNARQKS